MWEGKKEKTALQQVSVLSIEAQCGTLARGCTWCIKHSMGKHQEKMFSSRWVYFEHKHSGGRQQEKKTTCSPGGEGLQHQFKLL